MIKRNVDSDSHREELSILNMVGPQPTLLELLLFLTANCSSPLPWQNVHCEISHLD